MIVGRFKVKCRKGKSNAAMELFREIVVASRPLEGVVSFDIGRDIIDPDVFIAIEIFKDKEALDRQESLPVVKKTMGLFEELLVGEPEWRAFDVLA